MLAPKHRVALIGTGRVGYQFNFGELPDNHAEAVVATESCELVAGVNHGREKLEDFGTRFEIQALFHDHRQMLEEVKPDLCIIATHPELHAQIVEDCAQAPATRAIICEKPMALSLAECDRMIQVCDHHGVLLQINHNRRWHAQWCRALELTREGAIGDLFQMVCYFDGGKPDPSWRSDNEGPLLHDFTHYFDMMDAFGGEVEWLCGMAEQRQRPWAIEDFAAAFMKYRNGVTGLVHAAELSDYTDTDFQLRGSNGTITMAWDTLRLSESVPGDYEPASGFQWSALQRHEIDCPRPVSTYVVALEELVAAMEGNGELRSDGIVGRRSLELVMAVYQSQLRGNQPVRLPLDDRESGVEALRDAGEFVSRAGS